LTAHKDVTSSPEKEKKLEIRFHKSFFMLFLRWVSVIYWPEKLQNLSRVPKDRKGIHPSLGEGLKTDTNQSQACIIFFSKKKKCSDGDSLAEMIFSTLER